MKKVMIAAAVMLMALTASGQSRTGTGSGSRNTNTTTRETTATTGKSTSATPSRQGTTSSKSTSSKETTAASKPQTAASQSRQNQSQSNPPAQQPGQGQQSKDQKPQTGTQPQQPQGQTASGSSRTNHAPKSSEERVKDARTNYNDARMDYKGTKKQVKVDERQQPSYNNPPREPRQPERMHPQVPPRPVYSSADRYARTKASEIVVYTDFASRLEARDYIARLLADRYYTVRTYTSDTYIETEMTLVPTGYNTSTVFSMRFQITRSLCGRVRVYITGQWRETSLAAAVYKLIFQPDDSYATYYAWSVLEDVALNIPHYRIEFQR